MHPAADRPAPAARFLFRSDPPAIRRALDGALAALAGGLPGEADRQTLELVLAEVLNNVAEHAYEAPAEGVIELSVALAPGAVACEVVDSGRPMPGGELPTGPPPDLAAPGGLPEGGIGWFLIRALARELSYRRQAGRNRLAFRVPLSQGQPPP